MLEDIYLDKSLQVLNEDSRQRIVSRRVLTPKGLPDPHSPPPILRANVGTLTALTRTAPGRRPTASSRRTVAFPGDPPS